MADDSGVWVYAVAESMAPEWYSGVPGVEGQAVRTVTAGRLSAAVTTVSLAEFGERALRRNLENLAWLEAVARTHHQVIETAARHVPVVPMRLATVYHGDTRVAAMLVQRQEYFAAVLHRVAGRTEWGVKVWVAPPPAPGRGQAADEPSGGAADGPGAAFLRRRRAQLAAGENSRHAAMTSAEQIHLALGELAAASYLRPPQDRQLTGQAKAMVLNAAYLVDEERSADFAAVVWGLQKQSPGVRIELTGPWPPYSFASAGDDDPGTGDSTAPSGRAATEEGRSRGEATL